MHKAKAQIGTKHITPAGSNIFAELGFPPDAATKLKDRSNAIIAQKMNIKFALMQEIESWIEVEELKQKEAAQLLGVSRQRVSDVIRKDVSKFSIDSLIDMVARTGKNVRLHCLRD